MTKPFDPFDAPTGPLVVGHVSVAPDDDGDGKDRPPSHVIVLNRFPIIANHFILATVPFKPQDEPLDADDLAATYACLRAGGGAGRRLRRGGGGGKPAERKEAADLPSSTWARPASASQPHRHVQFLPEEDVRAGARPTTAAAARRRPVAPADRPARPGRARRRPAVPALPRGAPAGTPRPRPLRAAYAGLLARAGAAWLAGVARRRRRRQQRRQGRRARPRRRATPRRRGRAAPRRPRAGPGGSAARKRRNGGAGAAWLAGVAGRGGGGGGGGSGGGAAAPPLLVQLGHGPRRAGHVPASPRGRGRAAGGGGGPHRGQRDGARGRADGQAAGRVGPVDGRRGGAGPASEQHRGAVGVLERLLVMEPVATITFASGVVSLHWRSVHRSAYAQMSLRISLRLATPCQRRHGERHRIEDRGW